MEKVFKLVSGGQTGVDRAALDVGLKMKFEVGGWCPQGRLAEDGRIPTKYPLKELPGDGYGQRTRQNVIDSDGTLIIFFGSLLGGTKMTHLYCIEHGKPCLLVDAEKTNYDQAVKTIRDFLALHNITTLNVAGPRASEEEMAYTYTKGILLHFFKYETLDKS